MILHNYTMNTGGSGQSHAILTGLSEYLVKSLNHISRSYVFHACGLVFRLKLIGRLKHAYTVSLCNVVRIESKVFIINTKKIFYMGS